MATKKVEPLPGSQALSSMTRADIEQLIDVIHQKGIEEFELEQGGLRLRIVSNRPISQAPTYISAPPEYYHPAQHHHASAPPPPPQGTIAATSSTAHTPPTEDESRFKKVTSPMVGTFYRSPSPGAKPFVEVGDKVDEDTVLCIIEAMKLMNEIKAETRGIVRKIVSENSSPVEYGQTLYLIEPS